MTATATTNAKKPSKAHKASATMCPAGPDLAMVGTEIPQVDLPMAIDAVANSAPAHPASEVSGEAQTLSTAHEELVARLRHLWQQEGDHGLKIRHEMGSLINKEIGQPTVRQEHGHQVMKVAAERLEISESELSRMRWLAYHFESIIALKSQHPDVAHWTDFKKLLPGLSQGKTATTDGKEEVTASATPPAKSRAVQSVVRSLEAMASKIKEMTAPLNKEERADILEKLKDVAAAVQDKLQLRMNVTFPRAKRVDQEQEVRVAA